MRAMLLVALLLSLQLLDSLSVATGLDVEEQHMHPDLPAVETSARARAGEDTNEFWLQQGKDYIRYRARSAPNTQVAKNVILFVGDGMGLTTLAAARSYVGGEQLKLSFEKFPYTGLAKVYSVDSIVPDSACTATAFLCGVKSNCGTIGVNAQVERGSCAAMRNSSHHVHSIAKWALDAGKAAGFVTTSRVTHASPAALYAHTAERYWENDSELKTRCGTESGLTDIALQLIHGEVGARLKVMLGGGKQMFQSAAKGGKRTDGRDLLDEYKRLSTQNTYVETSQQLLDLDINTTNRLLGLFAEDHLQHHLNALDDNNNNQPTLEEMTKKAIELMQVAAENGYFLFIEGGNIDRGHHNAWPRHALDETAELSKAVEAARRLTSEDDTLIIVTADHSNTFTLGGYMKRGSDVFGVAPSKGTDDIPYLSLSYGNGPGFARHFDTGTSKRVDPEIVLNGAANDEFPSTVPLSKQTHGGEDAPVFASGPWSHLFTGVYEQNSIPHMMAYAACVGDGLRACKKRVK